MDKFMDMKPESTVTIVLTQHELSRMVMFLMAPPEDTGENSIQLTEIITALVVGADKGKAGK